MTRFFGLVRRALRETAATERRERDDRIAALRGGADRLLQRLDTLYIDKLDGRVTDEFHDRVSRQWRDERDRVLRDMDSLNVAEDDLIDDGIALMDIARNACEGFPRQPLGIKQRALNLILSNATYAGGELSVEFRQPFEYLVELPSGGGGKSPPPRPSNSAVSGLAPFSGYI